MGNGRAEKPSGQKNREARKQFFGNAQKRTFEKAGRIIKKSAKLPPLTLSQKRLKNEIRAAHRRAIMLMRRSKLNEAQAILDALISDKDFIEKKGLSIDEAIIRDAFLCSVKLMDFYIQEGLKRLASAEGKTKPNRFASFFSQKKYNPYLAMRQDFLTKPIDIPSDLLKITIRNKNNIRKALPYLAASLKFAASSLKYRNLLPSSPKMLTPLHIALKLSMDIDAVMAKAGIDDFLKNQKQLTEKDKKMLSHFFREKANLLSYAHPKRNESIWTFAKVGRNAKLSPILEHHGVKPIRVHYAERLALKIAKPDPISLLNDLAGYIKRNHKGSAAKRVAGLAYKLSLSLERFKKNPKLLKKEKLSSVSIADLAKKRETSKERIDKLKQLLADFNKSLKEIKSHKSFKEDKKLQTLISNFEFIVTKVPDWNKLMKVVLESKQNEEWPKAKRGEKSFDPRVEFHINTQALELFMKALRMDPQNKENYMSLFAFLKKIRFGGKLKEKFEKKLAQAETIRDPKKRKTAFLKIYQGVKDQIDATFGIHIPPVTKKNRPSSILSKLAGEKEDVFGINI